MICPECKSRMKCFDSANDPISMRTARRYRCDTCKKLVHTMEIIYEKSEVNYILSMKWQNGKR